MRFRAIAILVLPLMLAGYAYSQTFPGAGSRPLASERLGTIRGNVVMPDGSPISEAVKVTLKAIRGDVAMVYTDQQGRFELGNITPAQYTIEVDPNHERRFEITREVVQIQRGGGPTMVTLYLKEKQAEARAGADKTISVGMLDQRFRRQPKKNFKRPVTLMTKAMLLKRSQRSNAPLLSIRIISRLITISALNCWSSENLMKLRMNCVLLLRSIPRLLIPT